QANSVTEGDTLIYNISLDKPLEKPVSFGLTQAGGDSNADDYIAPDIEIPAFEGDTTFQFQVIFPVDDIPEESETISYTIESRGVGTKYSLNPDSKFTSMEGLSIENHNNPNGLSVVLDWENPADDLDLYGYVYVGGTYLGLENGATGDRPETILEVNGLAGVWYYSIDPYEYEQPVINYSFAIGYPDQTVEFYEGSFDASNVTKQDDEGNPVEIDGLTVDPNGGALRILKVISAADGSGGIKYTVENLNPSE